MITLFQESVPFTNKRLDKKISSDGDYTNPVIMPYAFDSTGGLNTFESVIYIRNDDQSKYYTNVLVTLMKEDPSITTIADTNGIINKDTLKFALNGYSLDVGLAYEKYYDSNITITGHHNNYIPVSNDGTIEVKFSYLYDEQSNYNWEDKKSALLIPTIGTTSQADMSYIPIRMRIKLLQEPSVFTIRDYFIDVCYEFSPNVVGA